MRFGPRWDHCEARCSNKYVLTFDGSGEYDLGGLRPPQGLLLLPSESSVDVETRFTWCLGSYTPLAEGLAILAISYKLKV